MTELLRVFVLHNWNLKLVSLLLAVGLWLVVSRDPMAEIAVSVPVELHNIATNLEISSESIPQAQIRIRGRERLVRRIGPNDVHAEIDLSGAKPGERTFDLTAQQIRTPRDMEVVQVVPSQFHLEFETRLVRQVEVHPRVIGSFAPGLHVAKLLAEPSVITISGPRKHVEAVEVATTDPVDASGDMQRASFVTHAYISDPLVQVVNPQPVRVTVIMTRDQASASNPEQQNP